jgi:hypothetical protein
MLFTKSDTTNSKKPDNPINTNYLPVSNLTCDQHAFRADGSNSTALRRRTDGGQKLLLFEMQHINRVLRAG